MKKMTVKVELGISTDDPDRDLAKVHGVLQHGTVRDALSDAGLNIDHVWVVDVETVGEASEDRCGDA